MLKRTITTAAIVALVGVMGMMAETAKAELVVDFHLLQADFDFTVGKLKITEAPGSILDVVLLDDISSAKLDSARIDGGGDFEFELSLDIAGAGTDWDITGILKFTDTTGGPPTLASPKVLADFKAESVTFGSGQIEWVCIEGLLSTRSGEDAILLGAGDTWTFGGESAIAGYGDADGVAGQVTLGPGGASRPNYDRGQLFTIKIGGLNSASLDDLFINHPPDLVIPGGEVKGAIIPVPAAVVLGLMGLGVMGWRMRRYA